MPIGTADTIRPCMLAIQQLLHKIDRLRLPDRSRRDVESILVRQVSDEIDRAMPWQAGHGRDTAVTAQRLGQALALTSDQLHDLKLAALLHDIGLLLLPSRLIAARNDLDAESYAAVQSHPRVGAMLLEPFSFLRQASVLIAHHHERWDGSGYPYGIRGTFIPLGSRILAVADAFDAIQIPASVPASQRTAVTLRILKVASGSQFDPALVELMAKIIRSRHSAAIDEPASHPPASEWSPLTPLSGRERSFPPERSRLDLDSDHTHPWPCTKNREDENGRPGGVSEP